MSVIELRMTAEHTGYREPNDDHSHSGQELIKVTPMMINSLSGHAPMIDPFEDGRLFIWPHWWWASIIFFHLFERADLPGIVRLFGHTTVKINKDRRSSLRTHLDWPEWLSFVSLITPMMNLSDYHLSLWSPWWWTSAIVIRLSEHPDDGPRWWSFVSMVTLMIVHLYGHSDDGP